MNNEKILRNWYEENWECDEEPYIPAVAPNAVYKSEFSSHNSLRVTIISVRFLCQCFMFSFPWYLVGWYYVSPPGLEKFLVRDGLSASLERIRELPPPLVLTPFSFVFFFFLCLSLAAMMNPCSDPKEQRILKLNECLLVADKIWEVGCSER
jgi:hypothetical protein